VDSDQKKKGSNSSVTSDSKLIEALEKSSLAIATTREREEQRLNGEEQRLAEEMVSRKWDKYLKLSETIDKLQEGQNIQLLFNFAKRVREVEKIIGIENRDSIVADIIDPAPTQDSLLEQPSQDHLTDLTMTMNE